ncbi:tripeptidyl-peptidase 2-like isoform X2 [Paramacrobiotus metropolitanus]|nr:tripeptidyl-peptidase 2-like isoform X2 [Paramacrobiotus metropolitanus]XP_055333691.1 tripeptidyl-peptidase 2-like isoform X2 [Paramacrobiotus metropolitanus]
MSIGDGTSYPFLGLIPKRETGVYDFLRKHPTFDGRGIKMCIMDSGVDPGAEGLQVTTTGQPKVIDILDASGAGDIDTSTVVEADAEGFLTGLTGRKLHLNRNWHAEDGKFHLGVVRLFSVVSEDYHDAWKKARKMEKWMPRHAEVVSVAMQRVAAAPASDAQTKEELDAQLEVAKLLDDKYEDLGPVMDIVVFHDGKIWWAALDTSETGDLTNAALLTDYRDQFKYGTIGGIYQINYTLNILDDGNRVELVIPQEHGTHVASIAAAHFPNTPERNGMAPGCQIVSIKIGHTLLDGSNETGTSLVRAFLYCMKNGVDIVNISYNEPYNWSDGGRVFEAIEMAVKQYGMIVCVANGNAGPGLTTVGSLPASPYTFGIGAYVTPDMMKELYGLTHKHPALMYNWTSRGPTLNGHLGACVCAPGGAVASIPTYTLKNSSLFNGTSMASPNACGSLAVVLSGLRARQIPWSAFHVRRGMEFTAKKLDQTADSRLAHGYGVVQVQETFEWLCKWAKEPERDVDIQVSVEHGSGIYIRHPNQLGDCICTVGVDLTYPRKLEHYAEAAKLCLNVALSTTADWVRSAEFVTISTGKKTFKAEVKTSHLAPGLHTASILGHDARYFDKGPVFVVPVTVCIPEFKNEWAIQKNGMVFKPGHPLRTFIQVPPGATWAEWRLQLVDYHDSAPCPMDASPILNFEYHAMQLSQNAQYKTHMFRETTAFPLRRVVSVVFPVSDRLGFLELAVALFWNRISSVVMDWSLDFHGLKPSVPEIVYQEGEAYYRVDVDAGGRSEFLQPSVSLTHLVQPIRPNEFSISPLSSRDTWPDGRITYQLILQYQFSMTKTATVEVTCPMVMDFLYENEIEGQMWKLYDANKRMLRCGEARVMRKIDFTAKLNKGDFVVYVQLRHDNRKILERFQDMVVHLRKKLTPPPITFDIVPTYLAALRGGDEKFKSCILSPHQSQFFFLMPPSSDKLGKSVHGSYFVDGCLYFAVSRDQPADAKRNAGAFPLKFILAEPGKGKAGGSKAGSKEGNKDLDDPVLAHQVAFFDKISDLGKKAELYESFLSDNKSPIQQLKVHHTYLLSLAKALDNKKQAESASLEKLASAMTTTCDAIIAAVDEKELLAQLGAQPESVEEEVRPSVDLQKSALTDALYHKCMQLNRNMEDKQDPVAEALGLRLRKFLDPKTDARYAEMMGFRSNKLGLHGRALKFSIQALEDKPTLKGYKEAAELADKLNWPHVRDYLLEKLPVLFPNKYDLF